MKKKIFLCLIFAVLISSCTEEKDKIIDVKTNNNLFDLSENEALEIAKSFQESVTSSPKTRTSNITFDIKSAYRLDASAQTRALLDERTPLVYEIEMNDEVKNGKIIVSGDKRFPEVLAYIPSFNDSLYKVSPEPNIMVQMAKNAMLDRIQNNKATSLTRSYAEGSVPGEVSVMIVPFCTTGWFQGSPYNYLLPEAWIEYAEGIDKVLGYSLRGNYPTGQAAVAIAQAMAYLQPYLTIDGTYINWGKLTAEKNVTAPNEDMVAVLFKYIYNTIGAYPVWGKSYNDRWPSSPETIVNAVIATETPFRKIPWAIKSSQCGLTCDNYQNWNLDVVKKSVLSLNPVLVGGLSRVAFLVDGYAINEENSAYLHCNFGRSENFNGYYLVHDDGKVIFDLNGWTYNDTFLEIIANIRNR